jgi:hypothetical protein
MKTPPCTRTGFLSLLAMLLLCTSVIACNTSPDEDYVSSRAYKGHENDFDIHYFVNAYPDTVGTRLDDCQTCHQGGSFTYDASPTPRTVSFNACDYCHMIIHPHDPGYNEPQPASFDETLNPFGQAYMDGGRNQDAFAAIADKDSDGDGYTNAEEIAALRYPGDPSSMPGQELAPSRVFTYEELAALPQHEQLMLANSHKQEFDNYAIYTGVRVIDLLLEVDVDDPAFEGITVIAPDGYLKDFSADQIRTQYPAGLFYAGLDTATLGTECGFVLYPDSLPPGLTDGGEIPGQQWLTLAIQRDGLDMDPSNLDVTSGKINGEGPYRIAVPQLTPGMPDRGLSYSPTTCNDGHDYDDASDHNAGAMVRGVIAIRVNPLPAGYEDFDYQNGGWAFIDSRELLVYGFGVTAP